MKASIKSNTMSFLKAMANTTDGLFAVDEDRRIIFWSEEAQRLLGYAPAEVLGRSCYEVMQGLDPAGNLYCHRDCEPVVRTLAGGKTPEYDLLTRTKDGRKRWVNVSIIGVPLKVEHPSSFAVVHLFRDIDARKAAEQLADKVASAVMNFSVTRAMASREPGAHGAPQKELTQREQEVLRLLAMGIGTSGIAQRMGVTQVTVRNHVQRILNKLGVHTRSEAVSYAFRHQMV